MFYLGERVSEGKAIKVRLEGEGGDFNVVTMMIDWILADASRLRRNGRDDGGER